VVRVVGAGRDGVAGHHVPGSPTADRVHGRVVFVEEAVTLELFVEAEDGAFGWSVDISGTTAATEEAAVRLLRRDDGVWWLGQGRLLEGMVVPSAAAAGMVEAVVSVERRGLGDDGHCG